MRERKRRGPADDKSNGGSDDLTELASDSAADLGHIVKPRLEELLAFAQVYRGWSAKELAKFIGRDVHNVIPASGIPKIDLVAKLAEALDWQPGAAFDHLCGGQVPSIAASPAPSVTDYRQLKREAYKAFEHGRFEDMVSLGLRMEHVAATPDERAEACLTQWSGWDGLGRHEQASDALRRGLGERDLSVPLKLRMRGNLAITHFSLGQWLESEGVAHAVLDRLNSSEGLDESADGSRATALFARGLSKRSRALRDADERTHLIAAALSDLRESESAWNRHAARAGGTPSYLAGALVCRGARLTAEALGDDRSAERAILRVLEEVDQSRPSTVEAPRAMREALGWWCVFGAELAIDLDSNDPARDRYLAQLTLLGLDHADACNNWALRERMLTIEYLRWSTRQGEHSVNEATVLDREDTRIIAGAMARFPRFRPFGWELVRRAARID